MYNPPVSPWQEGDVNISAALLQGGRESAEWMARLRTFLESTTGVTSVVTARVDALPAQEQLTLKVTQCKLTT